MGLDARVVDFWRFAMTDLRTNNVRGYLAEFLVARAVGASDLRVEWDPWDVTAPDGTKIEVKSSGYLQAWAQKDLSVPSFRVLPKYGWDATTGSWSSDQIYHADVYVFALHTAQSHAEYDPLHVDQWSFYVAGRPDVEARAGVSMGVGALRRVCGASTSHAQLASAIQNAAAGGNPP